ncbi:amidohydrolase family protein [Arenibaculum pallidiluteum]|uniref:amidohydrolase family protein n=1 Tax=Arenibaculum pallidiluteum TaxID=2812559 RepID=UPI001A95F25E|nr:amidohydrolase family protein [Arenibaculum pallidiluteum]
MRIDSHQHYWRIARGDYGWMTEAVAPIRRDLMPADLAPHLDAAGIAGTILVQAAPTLAETEFLLDLAESDARILGVVGWVDLAAPGATRELERLARRPKFRGIRPMLQDIADTFWILRPEAVAALEAAAALGLRLDALARPRHLPVVSALADRLPALPIVLDHCAKPDIAAGAMRPWARDIEALAERPQVFCKLSGLATEAPPDWTVADLAPYAATVLQAFGADRVMFGSDWPVLELAGTYPQWLAAAAELVDRFAPDGATAVFGGTAARFYGPPAA